MPAMALAWRPWEALESIERGWRVRGWKVVVLVCKAVVLVLVVLRHLVQPRAMREIMVMFRQWGIVVVLSARGGLMWTVVVLMVDDLCSFLNSQVTGLALPECCCCVGCEPLLVEERGSREKAGQKCHFVLVVRVV